MMKLLIATGNPHKLEEFRRILAPLGIEAISAAEVGDIPDVEETGDTFEANAELKARAFYAATGLPSVADDSGLCIDALGGRPGVLSARYMGDVSHAEKIKGILREMISVPDEKRTARFVAAICCVLDDDTVLTCRGECEGRIGYAPKGHDGFGYDPIFMAGDKSFAELSDKEKDSLSHRGKALRLFAEMLSERVGLEKVKSCSKQQGSPDARQ
jgi:XTP/dITP diphosphohydrolase